MRPAQTVGFRVLALAAISMAAFAQSAVISARSGLIHYVEGDVSLGGQPVETSFGVFPEVKENQQLKTGAGRAEVLLTPGVFLRVGENSAFRMITNRLIDTRLEFQSGSAVVEADDIGKDNSVTVVSGDATVHPLKAGIYRFDSAANELRVFNGVAEVTSGEKTVQVKEGHRIALDTMSVQSFDKSANDALNRWSERRSASVSIANVGAAASVDHSLLAGGIFPGGWYFNPYFGMYSFVPGFGMGSMAYSPYGCPLLSPFNLYMAYMPGGMFFSPCYSGFYGGYPWYGGGYPGYNNVYNTVTYRSMPPPRRPIGSGGNYHNWAGGTHNTFAGASSPGYGSSSSSSSVSSSSASSGVSHGGGGGGGMGGMGGGGGHH